MIKTKESYNGTEFNLASMEGKYVIVDLWGTWCGACLKGVPEMHKFIYEHADKVQILGIAQDNSVEMWRKCIKSKDMSCPNILNGKDDQDYVEKFNVKGFPSKELIDPTGKIGYRIKGEFPEFYTEVAKIISGT